MTITFTKFAGFCFILLSVLRLTPFINATGKWLLYVSLAAFFLILSDLIEFYIEGIAVKREVKLNKTLNHLPSVLLAGSLIAVIVLPYLKINIPVKQVNALSDAITLVSLGIAIALIGFKTERTKKSSFDKTNSIRDEIREYINSIEGKRVIDERISELSSQDTQSIGVQRKDSK
ncbi:hypothetical protein [Desulfosporosinus youngiae]|uniref:Uncharacterized protein n=1 Tax=Desulfosporosinus youngiae DSM 17734 TaxID=768710 RepID=H5XW55_9FIRM|nr:hypothetical protein [Desulfosporosinus youngiae]EHQ90648.1 hypothetical protein DesyoDRAFT_3650 [Desulfosporosinus youngiae DSM 17734]